MRFAALAALLLVAACQTAPPPEMTEAEKAQIEAEVARELASRTEAYREALLSKDAQAVISFWTTDAWFLSPGMNLKGDDLQAFMVEVFPSMTISAFDAEFFDVFVHGDIAYAMAEYTETVGTEGQPQETLVLNCFTRWENEDGIWKMDRDVCGPRDAPPED
jgi:ketosteroid isomerase-like protein